MPHLYGAVDTVFTPVRERVPADIDGSRIAYSRDGATRLECESNTVRIYDMGTPTPIQSIQVPFIIHSLLTPQYARRSDGFIAVEGWANNSYAVYKVSLPSGAVVKAFSLPSYDAVGQMFFSEDFSLAIAKQADTTYSLFASSLSDVGKDSTRKCLVTPKKKKFDFATFSPDKKKIVAVSRADTSIQIWDTAKDTLLQIVKFPREIFEKAYFTRSGSRIFVPTLSDLSGTRDGFAMVDAETGALLGVDSANACQIRYWFIGRLHFDISANDSLLAIGDGSNTGVIDLSKRTCKASFRGPVPNNDWVIGRPAFLPGDSSLQIPAYHNGSSTYRCYRQDIPSRKLQTVFSRQDRPSFDYIGFNPKGEPLLGGSYRYSGTDSYSGLYQFDTLVYWNAVTEKEFLKRLPISQPRSGSISVFHSFLPDGMRMIREYWYLDIGRYALTKIDVSDISEISDEGRVVASIGYASGSLVLAQNHRSVLSFDSNTVAITDAYTGDSSRMPFQLPRGWNAWGAVPERNIVFACSSYQKDNLANRNYWLTVWNLRTNEKIGDFPLASLGWFDANYQSSQPKVLLTPDGKEIIVASASGVKKMDLATGKENRWFSWKEARLVQFSPGGKHLLIGDSCYSTDTWEMERVYAKASLARVAFNPLKPNEFVSGAKTWELPGPSESLAPAAAPLRQLGSIRPIGAKSLLIEVPSAQGEMASFELFQSEGRRVLKAQTFLGRARQVVAIPELAAGSYSYRLEVPALSVRAQGTLIAR